MTQEPKEGKTLKEETESFVFTVAVTTTVQANSLEAAISKLRGMFIYEDKVKLLSGSLYDIIAVRKVDASSSKCK